MRLVLQVLTIDGVIAFTTTDHATRPELNVVGCYRTICNIPANLLNESSYTIKLHIGVPKVQVLIEGKEFLQFHIDNTTQKGPSFPKKWPGVVAPRILWKTKQLC